MKKVVMQLENARVEVKADSTEIIMDNSIRTSIEELREILSMYNYLNSDASTKASKTTTNADF